MSRGVANKAWAANKSATNAVKKATSSRTVPSLKKKKGDINDNDDTTGKDTDTLEKQAAAAKKKKDKDKKAKTFMQQTAEMNETDNENSNGVSFCNIDQHITAQLTVNLIFCNKKLVKNIRQVHDTMTLWETVAN